MKIKQITSYFSLNDKYNLNFSDNNFGFTWEVFKDLVTDAFAGFFTTPAYYRWAPTARNCFKTWNVSFYILFLACNFTDTSTTCIRRHVSTHETTTYANMVNATEYLLEKYNIDLTPSNGNGIDWPKSVKNGGEIVFPSGVRIRFSGYANSTNIMGGAVKGSGFLGTWTDEIIIPDEKESLTDEELDGRYTRLQSSLFRSPLVKLSYEKIKNEAGIEEYNLEQPVPIKEWDWTYYDIVTKREITVYFHKSFFNIFTCNPYDKHHYFYKKFVTPYLPLNEKVINRLVSDNIAWYEDLQQFGGLGIYILRLTAGYNWHKLPAIVKKLMLANKENNPGEYRTEYYGFEYTSEYDKLFPFRRYLKHIAKYDIEQFFNENLSMYSFDAYSLGLDWATGPTDHTVLKFWAFKKGQGNVYINFDNAPYSLQCYEEMKFDTNRSNAPDPHCYLDPYDADFYALYPYHYIFKHEAYDKYLIAEVVVTPNNNLTEHEKVELIAEEILGFADNFYQFENTLLFYDDKAKTAVSWIIKILKEHNLFIRWRSAIKHRSSLNKEAGLPDRVVWMRKQFLGVND